MTSLDQEYDEQDPLVTFTYGLKSIESRRQYPRRLKVFLDFLNIDGDIKEQARKFYTSAKNVPKKEI